MNFYSLEFKEQNSEMFLEIIGNYDEQKLRNGIINPDKLKTKISQGKIAYKVVRIQDPFNFLISKELKEEFEKENLTGWKTYEIETNQELKDYKGFQCIGKSGIPKKANKKGFVTGFHFDIETWDRNDFFTPKSTLMIICTEKAKKIIEKLGIENITLEKIESLRWYQV